MTSPSCYYANDEMFKFCQLCGYKRKRAQDNELEQQLKKVVVYSSLPDSTSPCAKSDKKAALEQELSNFLFSLPSPKSIATALPTDVVAFLVWNERGGRTRVHQPDCQRQAPCQCPLRPAHGTVDSLISKLGSIFERKHHWSF